MPTASHLHHSPAAALPVAGPPGLRRWLRRWMVRRAIGPEMVDEAAEASPPAALWKGAVVGIGLSAVIWAVVAVPVYLVVVALR